MSEARLAFDRVACARGGRILFDAMSFALGPGDAALVTGPNGAGKSSLLRLAAGLLRAAGGEVARQGAVALADEALALDARLPLAAALDFWAGIDGALARLDGAMAAMGIAHLAPVPVRILSTGQRKRAALARVIASGAPIWLLDEPGNGLDGDGLALLESAVVAHRAGGGLVLAATHMPIAMPGAAAIGVGMAAA
ncbi:MAG: heme ABC exporter ATP-binding protein CcmA [Sphingomonas sanxanigenens]|uniref:Heme ABC exporter ATP-binding protein CcmA n=1 Tax=Sphingomonas sanxanigenens TaxID=397260 RepID=A0A2W5AA00_9SPHN|nr:MAG: heme ABC exporter ATP-binding protein CcmA [Sphingomonas sanxanigenens]